MNNSSLPNYVKLGAAGLVYLICYIQSDQLELKDKLNFG